MKFYSASTRYPYSAELWDFYTDGTTNADGSPVKYYYKRTTVKLSLVLGENLSRMQAFADVPFPGGGQLRNVRLENGEEILPDAVYMVTRINPRMNPFGVKEGYQMVLALAAAGDFEYEFEEDRPPQASGN